MIQPLVFFPHCHALFRPPLPLLFPPGLIILQAQVEGSTISIERGKKEDGRSIARKYKQLEPTQLFPIQAHIEQTDNHRPPSEPHQLAFAFEESRRLGLGLCTWPDERIERCQKKKVYSQATMLTNIIDTGGEFISASAKARCKCNPHATDCLLAVTQAPQTSCR